MEVGHSKEVCGASGIEDGETLFFLDGRAFEEDRACGVEEKGGHEAARVPPDEERLVSVLRVVPEVERDWCMLQASQRVLTLELAALRR